MARSQSRGHIQSRAVKRCELRWQNSAAAFHRLMLDPCAALAHPDHPSHLLRSSDCLRPDHRLRHLDRFRCLRASYCRYCLIQGGMELLPQCCHIRLQLRGRNLAQDCAGSSASCFGRFLQSKWQWLQFLNSALPFWDSIIFRWFCWSAWLEPKMFWRRSLSP